MHVITSSVFTIYLPSSRLSERKGEKIKRKESKRGTNNRTRETIHFALRCIVLNRIDDLSSRFRDFDHFRLLSFRLARRFDFIITLRSNVEFFSYNIDRQVSSIIIAEYRFLFTQRFSFSSPKSRVLYSTRNPKLRNSEQ
jgi:hypothetical protein